MILQALKFPISTSFPLHILSAPGICRRDYICELAFLGQQIMPGRLPGKY